MPKGLETKNRIARSALELFVAQGVAETTTKDIAERANISEGGIYRHFPSKDDLAWELFLDHYKSMGRAIDEAQAAQSTIRGKADAIVRCYCEMADQDWTLFSYHLLTMHQQLLRLDGVTPNPVDVVEEVIAEAMRKGDIPARPVKILAAMALGVVLQTATHKIYGRTTMPLMDSVDMLSAAVWKVLEG